LGTFIGPIQTTLSPVRIELVLKCTDQRHRCPSDSLASAQFAAELSAPEISLKNGGFQVPTALRQIEHWLSYLTHV